MFGRAAGTLGELSACRSASRKSLQGLTRPFHAKNVECHPGGRETGWKADSLTIRDRPRPISVGFGRDFADAQSPEDFLVQPSADARIRQEVDTFLLSLPLGTSARDAAIEDRVAERLLSLHSDVAAMQDKVHEW